MVLCWSGTVSSSECVSDALSALTAVYTEARRLFSELKENNAALGVTASTRNRKTTGNITIKTSCLCISRHF